MLRIVFFFESARRHRKYRKAESVASLSPPPEFVFSKPRKVSEREKITEMSNRLPRELWTEILVSLPVKSLVRFQCVSKSMKSLISSPTFISMHFEHSESTDNYAHLLHWSDFEDTGRQYQLFQNDGSLSKFQEREYPSQIRGRQYPVALDCKGLVLFPMEDHGFKSLILWNPAIRMSMTLPRPRIDVPDSKSCFHGFGYDHTSNDYKVLRVVYAFGAPFSLEAELYKLRTGVWETVRGAEVFQYSIPTNMQALVNGAIHWFGCHKRDMASDSLEQVVMSFHLCDEEFRVMKLPHHLSRMGETVADIGVSDGFLCLMEHNQRQFSHVRLNIWLMKEYGVIESWTKQFTLHLRDWCFGEVFSFRNNQMILTWHLKGEEEDAPVLHDPKTQRSINLRTKATGILFAKNTFVESLDLIDEVNAIPDVTLV